MVDVLGGEDIFEKNLKLDFIEGRVGYLRKYTHKFYKDSKKQYVYAKAGYFYDTMEQLAALIQSGAGQSFKTQRAAILEQVELPFVAKNDRAT